MPNTQIPSPNAGQPNVNPATNPANQNAIPLDEQKRLDNQNRKTQEILEKIQARLSDVTSVRQNMQQGAFNTFGNNFITRGAMSAAGMVGDLLTGTEADKPPEVQLVDLAKKQVELLTTVLNETKTQTLAIKDFSSEIHDKMLGNGKQMNSGFYSSRDGIDTVDYVDKPDNPAIFGDVVDRLKVESKSPFADDNPNVFAQMSESLGKGFVGMPPEKETIIKANVDEIIDSDRDITVRDNSDAVDVIIKDEAQKTAKKEQSEPPANKTNSIFGNSFKPEEPILVDVKDDEPNSFGAMASALGGKSFDKKLDALDESDSEDAESDKAKQRFFKSVVSLLTNIDKNIDKQTNNKPLSDQEDILEANQNGLIGKFKEMLSSAIGGLTTQVSPKQESESDAPIDNGSNGIDSIIDVLGGDGKKSPKKSPGKTGKLWSKLGKVFSGAGKVARFARFAGLLAFAAAAYDGVTGWNNASDTLDLDREATFTEKAAPLCVAPGATFGLVDEKKVAKWLAPSTDPQKINAAQNQLDSNAKGLSVAPKEVESNRSLKSPLDQSGELDSASDALRRVENQSRREEKSSSDAPVQINTSNNTTNQSLFSSRRTPNNTEISFNRYVTNAMTA